MVLREFTEIRRNREIASDSQRGAANDADFANTDQLSLSVFAIFLSNVHSIAPPLIPKQKLLPPDNFFTPLNVVYIRRRRLQHAKTGS
jgi:hypothetical protein